MSTAMVAIVVFLCLTIHQAIAFDLNESTAVDLYMKKNLEVMASRYEIDIAKAEALTAGLLPNPSILADSQLNSFGKNWNQTNAGGPKQQDLILNIPLDINGKRRQAVRVEKIATKISEAQFQAAMRDGIFSVITNLYTLHRLEEEHELLREKSKLLESLVLTLEKRVGNPTYQPLIQSRARLGLEDIKVELEQNKINQTEVQNTLRLYLSLEGEEQINSKLKFKSVNHDEYNLSSLVQEAIKHRPDFQAIELMKSQSSEQIELEDRRVFNDITLQAGVSRQGSVAASPNNPGTVHLPEAWSWIVGVIIPIPVFDRNQGNILKAHLQSNQVLIRERFMRDKIAKDLGTSIERIKSTASNLRRYESSQLQNARVVRDSALKQFGRGASSLLEYLDAINAYHNSVAKYIEVQFDYSLETIKLNLLSGRKIIP